MRRPLSLVSLTLPLTVMLGTLAHAQSADSCIKSWPETRYGALAYNHVVHVSNSCDPDADCAVSTDVNPEPQKVVVPGHKEIEVMTFIGSPAREFKPNVKCTMRKP